MDFELLLPFRTVDQEATGTEDVLSKNYAILYSGRLQATEGLENIFAFSLNLDEFAWLKAILIILNE